MKKLSVIFLILAMLLAGCGQAKEEPAANVDLTAFYESVAEMQGLAGMVALEGEMLEACFPGLADIETQQLVAYAPMMSANVNEYVFVQCNSAEDAAAVGKILQERVDTQANGGAWYPESMAAWEKAKVIVNGNYALMIATWEGADEIVEKFEALL